MNRSKQILLWLMAAFYIYAGFNHLNNPEFYLAIMPPNLPEAEWLNVISGLAEIILGVFLLEPRTRVLAAWGIIALLIAVFPANLYVATANVGLPSGEPGTGNAVFNWVRLPFQALFIVWAWWYTRPDTPAQGDA
ncbi:MAG: DoxX family membrane protein [Deltaproteobacteria bacterium]|nr:DoxX family membrane protein [Deltaproteobacteria bacterium]MBW2697266.1 DoxX family membrane protein [Deltaproteobacteria bacterium]